MSENQIIIYQPNETVRLDVRLENETVWLNRHQMAQLFGRDIKTIGKHIANALNEELAEHVMSSDSQVEADRKTMNDDRTVFPTVAKYATVQNEGGRQVMRQVEYYSLGVVLSVGVLKMVAVQKRSDITPWATQNRCGIFPGAACAHSAVVSLAGCPCRS